MEILVPEIAQFLVLKHIWYRVITISCIKLGD